MVNGSQELWSQDHASYSQNLKDFHKKIFYYVLIKILILLTFWRKQMARSENTIRQVDIFPVIKHYMEELNVYGFLKEQLTCATQAQVEPAELLCMLIPNIMLAASPLYCVEKWVAKYADGLTEDINQGQLFNDDRLAWALDIM